MSVLIDPVTAAVRWHVAPEYRRLQFGSGGLQLTDWLRTGEAQIVKHGPHRTVYRVEMPGLRFFLKHYRLPTMRAWLRECFRPSKARVEYDRAVAVAARGVPTAMPLAFGVEARFGPGESYLITLALDDTQPLSTFLETTLLTFAPLRQTRVRQSLAQALGELLAKMHDAGIRHQDLHAGNILMRLDADDWPRLFLIDLHAVRLGKPLGRETSLANLVMLNRWFVMRAGRADRLRFWRAYLCARRASAVSTWCQCIDADWQAKDLERQTWKSNLRFWRSRDRRCRASNRYYRPIREKGVAGFAVRELDDELVRGFLADPDAPFEKTGIVLLKDSRSSTVADLAVTIEGHARPVIYKRFRVTSWTEPWKALFRRTAAMRSWIFGHGLRERLLPTARPLLVLYRRRWGLPCEGYLLTERIPDAVELAKHARQAGSIQRAAIEQLARLIREMHLRRLSHRDLKAPNLLVQVSMPGRPSGFPDYGPFCFIDLVGVGLHRKLARAQRVRDLARLHASFHRSPMLSRSDKLRFLRVYLKWGLHGKAGWKGWWRDIERATQAKVERNRRNGRPLA
jgi:hypothetical protein